MTTSTATAPSETMSPGSMKLSLGSLLAMPHHAIAIAGRRRKHPVTGDRYTLFVQGHAMGTRLPYRTTAILATLGAPRLRRAR